MAHLRSLQTGQHAEMSQKLLNQISTAKLCLLKADKRAEYDTALRARYAAQQAAQSAPAGSEAAAPAAGALDFIDQQPAGDDESDPLGLNSPSGGSYASRTYVRRRKKSVGPLLMMIGAPILGIAAVAVAIVIHNNQEQGPGDDGNGAKNVASTTDGSGNPNPSNGGQSGPRPNEGEHPNGSSVAPPQAIVYLDDLPEHNVVLGLGTLGKHGQLGYDTPDPAARVRVGSVEPHHALSTHPPAHGAATVSYQLDGKYRSFSTIVAILESTDSVEPRSPLRFRVLGDGRLLWSNETPLQHKGQMQRCNVSIEGANRLTLEVVCLGPDNQGCRAIWIDPHVSTQPTKVAPSGGEVAIDKSHGGNPLKPIPRDPRESSNPGVDPLGPPDSPGSTPSSPDSKPSDTKPSETSADTRGPVPDAAAQQKALAQLKDVLKDEYAKAVTAEGSLTLARHLGKLAGDEKDDVVARYVMAMQGLELAIRGGDVQLASAFVGGLTTNYQIDGWELKSKTLTQLSHTVKTGEGRVQIARASLELAEQALAEDRGDAALELAAAGATIAGALADQPLRDQVRDLRERARKLKLLSDEAKAARAKLATAPDDPDANLVLGRYLCLRRNNWTEGLPYLLKGNDPALKELARQETAAPASPSDQVQLADAWWDAADKRADKKDDPWGKLMQSRAGYWYRQAMPNLTGLALAKAKKRAGDDESTSPRPIDPAVQSVYLDDLREVAAQNIGYGTLGKHGATGYPDDPGEPRRVRLNNATPAHALSMHPPLEGFSQVTYKLDGEFRTFTATVAIMESRDRRDPASPVTFRLVGDGRPLWTSRQLRRQGDSLECNIQLRGIKTLILQVACGGINNAARAVWIDPQVSK